MSIISNLTLLTQELQPVGVQLVAVSKTKSEEEIMELYHAGQRVFGENTVQELIQKYEDLPKDIQWHLIGHLQSNKVKYIVPFITLIQSIDSFKLLEEINKQAKKCDRIVDCLLQIHIAEEESKFGMDHAELIELLRNQELPKLQNIRIRGLMGIATNTENEKIVKEEFYELKMLFDGVKVTFFRKDDFFDILSMGMSADYKIAITQGSNMIRVGSTLFGKRVIKHYKNKE